MKTKLEKDNWRRKTTESDHDAVAATATSSQATQFTADSNVLNDKLGAKNER